MCMNTSLIIIKKINIEHLENRTLFSNSRPINYFDKTRCKSGLSVCKIETREFSLETMR